jgi:hypothetical protein
VVIDDEGAPDVRTIGGVRTFEWVTIRNAAIAGYIDVSPPSPSLSPDKGSPLRAGPCRNCVRELRPGVVRLFPRSEAIGGR